jgi:hypothetical protein
MEKHKIVNVNSTRKPKEDTKMKNRIRRAEEEGFAVVDSISVKGTTVALIMAKQSV